jgi:uncharacterized membrane protein
MHIRWIDVLKSAVMWAIFGDVVLLCLKYLMRFFEELARGRKAGVYDDPEIRRKSWRLSIAQYCLVGLEMVLGALAIWGIWLLPGAWMLIVGTVFVGVQIGVYVLERGWQILMTKSAG